MTCKLAVKVVLQDAIVVKVGLVATTATQEEVVFTAAMQDEATKMFVLYMIVQDTKPFNVLSTFRSCTHQN